MKLNYTFEIRICIIHLYYKFDVLYIITVRLKYTFNLKHTFDG